MPAGDVPAFSRESVVSDLNKMRLVASVLVWVTLGGSYAFGQSKLDSRAATILAEIGRVRLLVVMSPPRPGERASFAYGQPAGFVASVLGDRGRHVRQIAGLPVVVVETDQVGTSELVDNP